MFFLQTDDSDHEIEGVLSQYRTTFVKSINNSIFPLFPEHFILHAQEQS